MKGFWAPIHRELVGTDFWQDFDLVGTVYKDNYKVLRKFSSTTVQELELQKGCLDLRCPKGTEQVLLIPCRSGVHTACLMPGRQVLGRDK